MLCARHCAQSHLHIISFNPPNNPEEPGFQHKPLPWRPTATIGEQQTKFCVCQGRHSSGDIGVQSPGRRGQEGCPKQQKCLDRGPGDGRHLGSPEACFSQPRSVRFILQVLVTLTAGNLQQNGSLVSLRFVPQPSPASGQRTC